MKDIAHDYMNQMGYERQRCFSLVVEFVRTLHCHDNEDVEFITKHLLGDFLIDAEILQQTQSCTTNVGVVDYHHALHSAKQRLQI